MLVHHVVVVKKVPLLVAKHPERSITSGHRLVYRVDDDVVFVTVVAIGKRDEGRVYASAKARLE